MASSIDITRFQHSHTFGTDEVRSGERRTRWVIALTFCMMVVEIVAGLAFGSMALLADGWHMATHAAALGIAAFAYAYARRHASDARFSFGTGKVATLGGFGSAVSLAVVAVMVLVESVSRLAFPSPIHFDEAIAVAVVGLVVNLVSAVLLHDHDHGHGHHGHGDVHDHDHDHDHEHRDHNLRGAYLHVLADALTSVFAIGALGAGKYLGWMWMDAMTGILGSIVIGRWSYGLLVATGAELLDAEIAPARLDAIRAALEGDGDCHVADLHVWRVGARHLAVIASVVAPEPREPADYKERLRRFPDLEHITVEVQRA